MLISFENVEANIYFLKTFGSTGNILQENAKSKRAEAAPGEIDVMRSRLLHVEKQPQGVPEYDLFQC